jgi:glycosyltransferase involved in cell wall biosynthesis
MTRPLQGIANVHVVGWIPPMGVPVMMEGLNVGLIPFAESETARCADPIKLYEYFALGKPVVSTYAFRPDAVEAGLMRVGRNDAFAEAIRASLADQADESLGDARKRYADAHDWSEQARFFDRHVRNA